MTSIALSLLSLVLIALLLGVHITGYAALIPALRTLDARTYVPVKQAIDLSAPRLARPLMLACLGTTAAVLIVGSVAGAAVIAIAGATALAALVATLVAILRGDLPINRSMANWSPDEPPGDWQATRARWEMFFALRVATNAAALVAIGVAVVSGVSELR